MTEQKSDCYTIDRITFATQTNPNKTCIGCYAVSTKSYVRLPYQHCLSCLVDAGVMNADGSVYAPVTHATYCRFCGMVHSNKLQAAACELEALGKRAQPAPVPCTGLSDDPAQRKAAPMFAGCLGYFPNALAYVAHVSQKANEQHNSGEPMHWAFNKSTDEGECIVRHQARAGGLDTDGLRESGKVAWRALAQLERELLAADPALRPGVSVRNFTRK